MIEALFDQILRVSAQTRNRDGFNYWLFYQEGMSQIFSPMIVLGVIVFGTANLIRSLPVEGGLPELIGTVAGSYVGIAILLAALKLGYLQIGSSDEESGTGLKGQPVERTESGELRPPETEGWTRKSTILIGALVVFTVVLLSFLYL